jgi:hypothetical protein
MVGAKMHSVPDKRDATQPTGFREMIDRSDPTSDHVHYTVLQSDVRSDLSFLSIKIRASFDRDSDRPIGIRGTIVLRTFYCTRGPTSDRNNQLIFREALYEQCISKSGPKALNLRTIYLVTESFPTRTCPQKWSYKNAENRLYSVWLLIDSGSRRIAVLIGWRFAVGLWYIIY